MADDRTLQVFIGWDARETDAYEVCRFSIVNRVSTAVHIEPLKHRVLRQLGLFERPWKVDPKTGQWFDGRDRKPFSTEFAFTRFLVPAFAKRLDMSGWALFCDCDFLFLADIAELFDMADPDKAVMVVKHDHKPDQDVKMDQVRQTRYPRKNWSSLILWNLDHEANRALTPELVNAKAGSWLHRFRWLPNDLIGSLPPEWNHLVGVVKSETRAKAVHYTLGGPWWPEYQDVEYAHEWRAERAAMMNPRPTVALMHG